MAGALWLMALFDANEWAFTYDPRWDGLLPQEQVWSWFGSYHWHAMGDMVWCLIGLAWIALLPDWRGALWFSLWIFPLVNSGLEDVLFYLVQGQPIPPHWDWLDDKWWAFGSYATEFIYPSIVGHIAAAIGLWRVLDTGPEFLRRRLMLVGRMVKHTGVL